MIATLMKIVAWLKPCLYFIVRKFRVAFLQGPAIQCQRGWWSGVLLVVSLPFRLMSEVVLKQTLLFRFFSLKIVGKMLNGKCKVVPVFLWCQIYMKDRDQESLRSFEQPSSTNTHFGGSTSSSATKRQHYGHPSHSPTKLPSTCQVGQMCRARVPPEK